jgi:hypothetical protein
MIKHGVITAIESPGFLQIQDLEIGSIVKVSCEQDGVVTDYNIPDGRSRANSDVFIMNAEEALPLIDTTMFPSTEAQVFCERIVKSGVIDLPLRPLTYHDGSLSHLYCGSPLRCGCNCSISQIKLCRVFVQGCNFGFIS